MKKYLDACIGALSGMKKFLLPLICLLLVVGCAAGGYFYLIAPANAKSGDARKQDRTSEKTKYKNTQFVKMGRLTLPIIGDNGVSQIVHMTVQIEVKDKKAAKKVEKLKPRIKDAYLQNMYGVLTREAVMRGGALKVKAISSRLKLITKKVMGDDSVRDVLVQSVHQRPA